MTEKQALVSVVLSVAVPRAYSYAVPEGWSLKEGDWVTVPLGPRSVIGVVWSHVEPEPGFDPAKIRSVEGTHDAPPLSEAMRRYIDWVAAYTMTERGSVLKMVLRVPDALSPPPLIKAFVWSGDEPDRLTRARGAVLDLMRDGFARTSPEIAREAGVSASVVKGLVDQQVLASVALKERALPAPDPDFAIPQLNDDQGEASTVLCDAMGKGGFSVHLLDGVTGSGKTEVYFEAVGEALRDGRQALILLPEIALTAQFIDRFEQRFGARPALWHSDVRPKDRTKTWRGVLTGDVKVVVGARSSLFLPFSDLGLIVVDEEHEAAYKQEDRVWYNARDMAVVRGQTEEFPVILASATPSVESRANADAGRYKRLVLSDRFGSQGLPSTETIDLRIDPPERGKWLSPVLQTAIIETLNAGHQSLLFLNRRGYAPLTLCRACGHRFACPNCTSWLTEHRFRRKLVCHHCGMESQRPEICPACEAEDSLVACGPGIERIAEEVVETFPAAQVALLSSDLTPSTTALREQFRAIESGAADIIIGTQLIAKGHNFPGLALVGIIDADMGLGNGDLRATERTFQLISQVVGRAGRARMAGRALIQTYMPDHPVLKAIVEGDTDGFYQREIEARHNAAMPPFSRLAALVVSASDRGEAYDHARAMARHVPAPSDAFEVLGPAEAPLAVLRGRYRYRFLVRAARNHPIQASLRAWLDSAPRTRGSVRVSVDIDPYSFV